MNLYRVAFAAAAFCLLTTRVSAFDPLFDARIDYSVGSFSYPSFVCSADLDGDGDRDLAVANSASDNISILKNNGDGAFAAFVSYGVGDTPLSVCAADLDGDGDRDLAVANKYSNNISILKNNGNGTFAAAVSYGVGTYPYSVCAADLDGDGDSDLAVANGNSNTVSILKNNGSGGFAAAVNYFVGSGPVSVCAADLDGDGDRDLAFAGSSSNTVSILKNNGSGVFAAPVNYDVGNNPRSVCAVDLDGDGDSDLAVANSVSNTVSILKNNGNGVFAAAMNYGVGGNAWSVCLADLDGDGDSDLAVANYGSNTVSILKNNGSGVFAAPVNYGVGSGPESVCAADLDGDGDSDLAVANSGSSSVSILKNNGNETFAAAVNYGVGSSPISVCAADLDGDGDSDLAVANMNSNNVSILKNNGNGIFAAAVNYVVGTSPWPVCAADLDGDGDSDLVVANYSSNNVSILKNNRDGTFAAAVNYAAGGGPRSVCAADLDGDGDSDLVVANPSFDNVSILKNNGNGTFAEAVSYYVAAYPVSVCAADLDGDGDDDLAVVSDGGFINFSILMNNGNGTFAEAVMNNVGGGLYSICAADLDGDGDSDLAVASPFSFIVSILKNNGDGTFVVGESYGEGSFVRAADLDGDGDNDLVMTNEDLGNVSVLRNNGDGTFAFPENYVVGGFPSSVCAADLDGDGDNDLAVPSSSFNNVSILINISPKQNVPARPSDLAAQTISSHEIDLTWHDESSTENSFELWQKTGVQGVWSRIAVLPPNSECWANAGLAAGNVYYYRVRACNGGGCSAWSNTVTATSGSIPAAPSNLVATAVSAAQIDLTWQDNSTNELGFKIERKLGVAGQWLELVSRPGAGSTAYQDYAFNASGTYYYRIRAYNEAGNSDYSPTASATNQDDPSAFDGTVEVRLGTAPVAGATVRIYNGVGFVDVGPTDSNGRCSVTGLSIGNRLQARKMLREYSSIKQDHGEVGNKAWELWADSDHIQDDGSYESVLVDQQKTPGDPYVLTLVHPIFKFNLVVSVQQDIRDETGTGYWEKLQTCFNKASNLLYDITDGQAMFNKIVIYDCGVKSHGADVLIADEEGVFCCTWVYHASVGFGWNSSRKIRLTRILDWSNGANYGPIEFRYYRGVVHEFGHWAFLLRDEYRNGKPKPEETYFFWYRIRGILPWNFGLMDQDEGLTEMSSQNDYPAAWDGDPKHTTMQYAETNKSCWDYFESLYNTFLDPGLKITKPLPGNFENQAKPPRRDGPVITSGVADTIVLKNTGDGSFETQLHVVVAASPAVGAYVFKQGRRGIRYLGQVDGNGRLEVGSADDDDVIFAYRNGHSHSQKAERATSSLRLDGPLQSMTARVNRSAAADAKAPGAVVDAEPVQPLSNPSILVRIWPDEALESAPLVTAHVGGSITPVAMTANGSHYSGSVAIDTADTLYSGDGFFDISLSDTAGNGSTYFLAFKLWDVPAGSELLPEWGSANCFLGSDDITQSSLVLVTFSNASLIPTGSNLTSRGDQFSIHVSPADEYPSGAAINISYDDTLLSGVDETSVTIMRWNPTGLNWVPVSGSLGAAPINVVSASIPTGGVYRAFATASSSDATVPSAVNDLGAVGTQNSSELILDWTAPGDDGVIGTALDYIVAHSESLITEENWLTTDKSVLPKQPGAAGSYEMATILLPEGGQSYYLALRARDEAGNMSPLSNIAHGVTGIWDPNLVTGPPRDFRALDRPSDEGNGVLLTWEPSFDDGGGKGTVQEYRILRTALSSVVFQPVDTVPAGTTSIVDSTVEAGVVYRYWVAAADSVRESYSEQNGVLCALNVGVPTGDFTSDAVVGVDDFSYLVDSYAIDSTDAEFDPLYDMNEDGQIYAADFDSLRAHFGAGGVAQSDSGAANEGATVQTRWVHITGSIWHLNVSCSSVYDLAGYSLVVDYDGSSMVLASVDPDTAGAGSSLLNSRGGLTPLFLVKEGGSSVIVADVIMNSSEYTSVSGGGLIANLVFNCSFPASASVHDIVLMDSEKRLTVIDHATAVSENPSLPRAYVLYPNYPNPFNPATTIKFDLPAASKVVLRVYDVTGREVATLANRRMDAGQHTVVWNGQNKRGRVVASGVYFCRLEAGKFVATRKLVMLR